MSYFGTDGIRGTFGVFPITPDFLLRLGFVAGRVLSEQNKNTDHRPSVLIGKDTRLSGYVIEAALQAGFNAAGVDVHMLGVIPTPAIAHLTRSFHADMGVVISASHNPYSDNGVKFFSPLGKKISDATQNRINELLDADLSNNTNLPILNSIGFDDLGKNHRIDDAVGRYIEFCKGSFPYTQDLRHLTIALDCANGAAYKVAPRVFRELGATVITMANTPDGKNINNRCGSTHPETLQAFVKSHNADIGIALDGDGDRIIMVDHLGNLVDGDGILYILATHADTKPVGVVGTVMSNMALQLALEQQGIAFVRTKVGDRYVMQSLDDHAWQLGGESSGHILTLDKAGTGDAIIAGLQVLACMTRTQQSLATLLDGYNPMPQVLINVKVTKKQDPYQIPALAEQFAQAEKNLINKGRLLIRPSGTEPLIRVMVESHDKDFAVTLAQSLADAITQQLT